MVKKQAKHSSTFTLLSKLPSMSATVQSLILGGVREHDTKSIKRNCNSKSNYAYKLELRNKHQSTSYELLS